MFGLLEQSPSIVFWASYNAWSLPVYHHLYTSNIDLAIHCWSLTIVLLVPQCLPYQSPRCSFSFCIQLPTCQSIWSFLPSPGLDHVDKKRKNENFWCNVGRFLFCFENPWPALTLVYCLHQDVYYGFSVYKEPTYRYLPNLCSKRGSLTKSLWVHNDVTVFKIGCGTLFSVHYFLLATWDDHFNIIYIPIGWI